MDHRERTLRETSLGKLAEVEDPTPKNENQYSRGTHFPRIIPTIRVANNEKCCTGGSGTGRCLIWSLGDYDAFGDSMFIERQSKIDFSIIYYCIRNYLR